MYICKKKLQRLSLTYKTACTSVWKSFLNKLEGIVGLDLGQTGLDNLDTKTWSVSGRVARRTTSCLILVAISSSTSCSSSSTSSMISPLLGFSCLVVLPRPEVILNSTSSTILISRCRRKISKSFSWIKPGGVYCWRRFLHFFTRALPWSWIFWLISGLSLLKIKIYVEDCHFY